MKNKHLTIAEDSVLLKNMYQTVNAELIIDKNKFNKLMVFKAIFYAFFTVLIYLFLFKITDKLLFHFCFILCGFMSVLCAFNFSHDFAHDTVFKNKKWNNWGFIAVYTLVGAHAEAWKQRHIHAHHYAPNVEHYDSDLELSNLIRLIPDSKYLWFHRFQHIYAPFIYTIYSLFWIFIKDFRLLFSKDEYTKNKDFRYFFVFFAQKIVYLGYILLLPILFSQQSVVTVLMGFLWMHLVQSLFLLFTFFITHHVESTHYPKTNAEGFINTSWLMNQIKSSNDVYPFNRLINFILGGFNNHIAHHLFPNLHHIYYPELNKIIYPILIKNGIKPNQTTYFGGIYSHLKLLKKMGEN
jgi:linoleoyl-CoA desaturase